eukprot:jgi/Astpho2/5931/Aster-x1338
MLALLQAAAEDLQSIEALDEEDKCWSGAGLLEFKQSTGANDGYSPRECAAAAPKRKVAKAPKTSAAGTAIGSTRVQRFAANIVQYLYDNLCAGQDFTVESIIREKFKNSPDTSKALRMLLSSHKVQRKGRGGRQDPFAYSLRAHEVDALKAGCGGLSPDSPPLPGDRAAVAGSPGGEAAHLCATKAEAEGPAQHGSQQAGSTAGPDHLTAAAAARPTSAGPCTSSPQPAQGRRAFNAAAAGRKRKWPAEAKADAAAEAAWAESRPKCRRQEALPAADMPVPVPATADSGCQTEEMVLVAHKHGGRVMFVLPDLHQAAQHPVPHSAWQPSMLSILQAEAASWSGGPKRSPVAVSPQLAADATAALGRTGLTMQDLQQHLHRQATQEAELQCNRWPAQAEEQRQPEFGAARQTAHTAPGAPANAPRTNRLWVAQRASKHIQGSASGQPPTKSCSGARIPAGSHTQPGLMRSRHRTARMQRN